MELITSHINLLSNCMKDEHVIVLQNALESFGPLDILFTKEYNAKEARNKLLELISVIENTYYRPNKVLTVEILTHFIKCNKHLYANEPKLSNTIYEKYIEHICVLKQELGVVNDEYIITFYAEIVQLFEEFVKLVHDNNVCM